MSFKYINPGYAGLLSDRYPTYKADVDATGKSKTGSVLVNYRSNEFLIPPTLENDEIWMRFDSYLDFSGSSKTWKFGEFTGTSYIYNGFYIAMWNTPMVEITLYYSNSSNLILRSDREMTNILNSTGLKDKSINSIWMHLKHGDAGEGFLELQINDVRFEKIQNAQFKATSDKRFGIMGDANDSYFSNIICSDEEISILETIVPVPINLTETDMSFDSDTGIYTASAANQTILQSVDVSSLGNDYGSDSTVTGIALIGNPAYKTELGLSKLTAVSKENGVITDYETNSLLEDTSAMILSSRKLENKTMSDLQNIQFGWKSGN